MDPKISSPDRLRTVLGAAAVLLLFTSVPHAGAQAPTDLGPRVLSGHSGSTAGRTFQTASRRAVVSDAFLSRLSKGKGRVVLTASRSSEVSEERDNLGHGVFTYYLLEGLKGKADQDGDGIITVDEVCAYVSKKVPEATGQNQHPVKKGEVEGQLVLGHVR